jgi:putative transposase
MLDLNQKYYQENKKFKFAIDMANLLPELKKEHAWLKDTPSQSLQQKCIDLDHALKSVWKSNFGFPKFKAKHKSSDSFRIPQTNGHIKITPDHIQIPKIGKIDWCYHRPIPENSKIKNITITKDIDDWYVSILLEIPDVPLMTHVDKNKTVGIDLGLNSFAILSDGSIIESQRFAKKAAKRLRHYQRQLKHKVNGSANSKKAYKRIAKIHRDIRNARSNWLHCQSKALVEKYDVICIENLSIKEMQSKYHKYNGKLKAPEDRRGRSIADQGWGIFVNQLMYKAAHKGKHVTKIGEFDPSTQTCSCCGTRKEGSNKLKLSDREFICQNSSCNDYLKAKDRDINAAINIHFWGLMQTKIEFLEVVDTDGTSEINACGDTQQALCDQAYDWPIGVSTNQEAKNNLEATRLKIVW